MSEIEFKMPENQQFTIDKPYIPYVLPLKGRHIQLYKSTIITRHY